MERCKAQSWRLAELYLALSNLHRVEAISELLTEDEKVYGAEGRVDALGKMKAFHATYSDAFWTCSAMRHVGEEGLFVEFDFRRYFTGQDGRVMTADATDIIGVCPTTGKIKSIGYSRQPSAAEPALEGFPEGRDGLLEEAKRVVDECC